MSTMLKTAAMTLLSKTLQTFLYKYLSDVDVEGVALPSVYDGSGWGVRLSNVKLREGVQLMKELPGKAKKKRKRKRKKKQQQPVVDERSAGISDARGGASTNGELSTRETENGPRSAFRPVEPEEVINGDLDASLHVGDIQRRSSKDYFEDDEKERPSTPDQNSKSIFSCFQGSRSAAAGSNNASGQQPRSLPEISLHDKTVTEHRPPQRVESEITFEGGTTTDASFSNRETDAASFSNRETDAASFSNRETDAASFSNRETSDLVNKIDAALEDDVQEVVGDEPNHTKEEKEVEEDEEEEFEEYEQPLKLVLGENGRIGTLDIRLIGKELHVLVEDAVLTIEAIPIIEDGDDENDVQDASSAEQNNLAEDAAKLSGNVPNAAPQAKAKDVKKKKAPRVTVGDRVLADIPLARAIASIPHLFLRDIHIRLIIRNEARAQTNETTDEDTEPRANNDEMGIDEKDCVLEIGIEFLSVTSGEDVLSHFQQEQDEESEDESDQSDSARPPMNSIQSYSSVDNTPDQNEYLLRHIRTGRGPSAGISVRLFSPGKSMSPWDGHADFIWARQQWMLATEFYLLRCSGLDVRAKIPLGTKKEVAGSSWFYGEDDDGEAQYDEYTLDSLIFGVDHVAPGPQLPLPPISPHMSRGDTPMAADQANQPTSQEFGNRSASNHPGSDTLYIDQNGIQSCHIPSSFHRVARGMIPAGANNCSHLPSQLCPNCWDAPHGIKQTSELDDSIPMPGLTMQVTMRDPLELNVDRNSLETIGMLQSLFQKKKAPAEAPPEVRSDDDVEDPDDEEPEQNEEDGVTETTASTSYFGSMLTRKTKEPAKETKDPSDAFAKYMQPENLQVLGVYLSEIRLRLHVMSETENDNGLSFYYWDLMTTCLTIDQQSLKSKETTFQDVKLDVGHLTWHEQRGVNRSEFLSFGIAYPERRRTGSNMSYVSMATVATIAEPEDSMKTPWPSTASALMDIPAPLESMIYKRRERHGIQLRFVSVNDTRSPDLPMRSSVNVRIGMTSLTAPWGFWRKFGQVNRAAVACIRSPQKEPEADPKPVGSSSNPENETEKDDKKQSGEEASSEVPKPAPPIKSLMKYKIQVDGGSMILEPVLRTNMPLTQFCGERSTDTGIFIESIFQKLQFAYGSKTNPIQSGHLDVQKLAALPENVRMRILLCLDDLGPLEEAFQVKTESNSFKRCRAVNKGILKMARKLRKQKSKTPKRLESSGASTVHSNSNRRQQVMNEVMKLSDKELHELWNLHQRQKRRAAKASKTKGQVMSP